MKSGDTMQKLARRAISCLVCLSTMIGLGCGSKDVAKPSPDQPLVSTIPSTPSQEPRSGDFPLDEILNTIRTRSVFRNDLNWIELEASVRAKAAKANTKDGKAKAILDVLIRMDDVHSRLVVEGKSYSHYEVLEEPVRQRLLPLLARRQQQIGKPIASILDGNIGYVLVPGMQVGTPEQIAEAAKELHEKVSYVASQKPKGWVVDLRLNGGGNLYPMLIGLRPLLGDGVVGGTIDGDGRLEQKWVLKSDGLYWRDSEGDRRFAELDMKAQIPDPSIPVVVLLGPLTSSSGQGTALAFTGRPRCHMLGEPTAKGYTTVIAPFYFGNDVMLNLAVGYMADRNGQPCKLQVLPTEIVEAGDTFDNLSVDKKVLSALRWLKQNGN
jgi:carboxyl-terminal processing protease